MKIKIICGILVCLLFCSCDGRRKKFEQRMEEYNKEQKIEMEKKMAEREIESHKNYIQYLKEQMNYQNCFFISKDFNSDFGYHEYDFYNKGNKHILVITVEGDYPIVNRIDILDGEIIIKEMFKLDKIISYVDYGHYNFFFLSEDVNIQIIDDELKIIQLDGWYYTIVKYSGQSIPEKVFLLSSDNQKQYTGEFIYNGYKIISQENEELDIEKEYKRIINISLNQDGYLIGKNIIKKYGDEHDVIGYYEIEFKIYDERKVINSFAADGGGSSDYRLWFYKDRNIIQFEHDWFHHVDQADENEEIRSGMHYIVEYVRK